MKKKLLITLVTVLAVALVVTSALVTRSILKKKNEGKPYMPNNGEYRDPNQLDWDYV